MIDTPTLLETINKAMQSGRRRKQAQDARSKIRQQIENLTTRELQVVLGLLKGWSNRQIADEINLAERTVKYHRTMISRRYSIKSPVEIARMVWTAGINESQLEQMIQERTSDHQDDEELH